MSISLEDTYSKLYSNPHTGYLYQDGKIECITDTIHPDMYMNFNIIPGSFNPIHSQHKKIFDCRRNYVDPCLFEISITRYNKSPYSIDDISYILGQFNNYSPVLITNAPRFIDKISWMRNLSRSWNISYTIGIDTFTKLYDDIGFSGISSLSATFYVVDRIVDRELYSLKKYSIIPHNCHHIDIEPSDISSTSLRNEDASRIS